MTIRPAGVAIAAAVALAGCGIQVEDWSVSCGFLDPATCRPVAALALKNLSWRHPARPQGTITVQARNCPVGRPWPDWADPSQCWQVVIPLDPGPEQACMIIARRPELGGYGQVAGDTYLLPASHETRGCPS
jgi:hypothetical protein